MMKVMIDRKMMTVSYEGCTYDNIEKDIDVDSNTLYFTSTKTGEEVQIIFKGE